MAGQAIGIGQDFFGDIAEFMGDGCVGPRSHNHAGTHLVPRKLFFLQQKGFKAPVSTLFGRQSAAGSAAEHPGEQAQQDGQGEQDEQHQQRQHRAGEAQVLEADLDDALAMLRDGLGLIGHAAETRELARGVPDNEGVYFVPAFSGLFAPYWKSDARGVIVGMTRYVNRGHFARAALEIGQVGEVLEDRVVGEGFDMTDEDIDALIEWADEDDPEDWKK